MRHVIEEASRSAREALRR
jgi:predicted RNA binding protein YcfA (HicA-like mRNA interferase family)